MCDTIQLNLAGWRVALQVSPAGLADSVASRYHSFTCPPSARADLVVEVEAVPLRADDGPASILHASLTTNGEDYLLDGPTFYGMIGPLRGLAVLRMRSDEPAREVEYFLRIALALFALQRDGLLLHCAALMRTGSVCTSDGTGPIYLFVGQSGSGKSTVVTLSQASGRARALGDDLILLRREPRGWCAHGTPFWNYGAVSREGEAGNGLVGGIYKLVQNRAVFAEPMGRAAAVAELVANCPIVNDQPALLPVLVDRCRDVAEAIGVRRLHFRKDDAFWDVIPQGAP